MRIAFPCELRSHANRELRQRPIGRMIRDLEMRPDPIPMNRKLSIVLFVLGVALLSFGLLTIRGVYLHSMAWASLVFGALLVLLAGYSWKLNAVVIAIPAVIVATWYYQGSRWDQKILLPSGYAGPFGIIYGQACGAPVQDEFGCYVIRIPPNGVAITQLPERKVNGTLRFFYVRGDGLETPILTQESWFDTAAVVFPRAGYVDNHFPAPKVECSIFFLQRSTLEPVPWHGARLVRYRADSLMFACRYGGVLARPEVLNGHGTDTLP